MLSEAKHLWFIPLSGIGRKIDPRFFAFAQNDNLVWLLTPYEVVLYCIRARKASRASAAT